MDQPESSVMRELMTIKNIVILDHFWVHQEFWYTKTELTRILAGKLPLDELDERLLFLQTLQLLENSDDGHWRFNKESKLGTAFNHFQFQLIARNVDLSIGLKE